MLTLSLKEYFWKNGLKLTSDPISTPAFIYDENKIFSKINNICKIEDCNILFPLKSFAIIDALNLMAPLINGFSTSSLFESKLARDILHNNKTIHMTTPGLQPNEVDNISELCDYISFNSLSQWNLYHKKISSRVKQGLRINPQLSFIKDSRYNPCRKNSKLGVPLVNLISEFNNLNLLKNITGLHFHTNCESNNFHHLLETVKQIETCLPTVINKINWINLGGGYLLEDTGNIDGLLETIKHLKTRYDLDIFFEPGKGIIGDAGYIVSTILDLFKSDDRTIAILDTSVNHMPEVFEYQYKPDVIGESVKGKHRYILAGASCLAGDVFGEYRFDQQLDIGSKIIFEGMGAYTMVKANMFNGINLPSVYAYTLEGKLELKRQFIYEDFISRCGVIKNATE